MAVMPAKDNEVRQHRGILRRRAFFAVECGETPKE
jgi:hypothetical protein